MSSKQHWENIYTTTLPNEVSWTETEPKTSLHLIAKFNLPKDAKIIDIGGGDSHLVDFLLHAGYTNITVLDIAKSAIDRAKIRLGKNAHSVTWIVSNILDFEPSISYDLWHDRAAFHFLTEQIDIDTYLDLVYANTNNIILGTFSTDGPLKCSGLQITQYDEPKIQDTFGDPFHLLDYFTTDHSTPFNTHQSFSFARLSRKNDL